MKKEAYDQDYFKDINEQTVDKMQKKYKHFLGYAKLTKEPQSIVDIGCGSGTMCGFFLKEYTTAKVVGVDFYQESLDIAAKRYPKATFINKNLEKEKLPFKDNSIDLVTAHEVIEHVHNLDSFLGEIKRILKPDGIFLAKTPNGLDLMRIISPMVGQIWYADTDKTHVQYFNFFSGKKLLLQAGFTKVKTFTGTKPLIPQTIIPAPPIIGNGLVIKAIK